MTGHRVEATLFYVFSRRVAALMTLHASSPRDARRLGAITLLVAVAQISLVALALGRVLDPGSMTFEVVGILAGLGMATGASATVFGLPSRNAELSRRIGALGIVAGLGYGAVWLSLLGGEISFNDLPRLAIFIACDLLFTVWLVRAARAASPDGPRSGFSLVAVLMSLHAIGELLLCVPLVAPAEGPGPNYGAAYIAILVLVEWVVLALWELSLGLWLLRTRSVLARRALLP